MMMMRVELWGSLLSSSERVNARIGLVWKETTHTVVSSHFCFQCAHIALFRVLCCLRCFHVRNPPPFS
ncbi:hypothetical protein ERO13_D01G220900v2 [Gossypium hirsutum]|uniref:Uncharacterized protein n=1 Tax=Gossypium tomentosum TaxID=34277 RepID=A0A5D2MEE4_GOSTO|nr:hypothetical protein ERO13_D01G220900v2 [Gossypium hirsutum]TYH89683.1 hypothetical protein ES332_D01G280300v1 [Gossypium tomentosum]